MKTQAEIRDWNAARFEPTGLGGQRGHVESYFLKLNDREGRRALWIKATILAREGSVAPVAEAWAIAFDRAGAHAGAKEIVPFERARFSRERLDVRVADLAISAGEISGSVASHGRRIELALRFTTTSAPLVLFPSLRMYEGPLPSSKLVSPYPDARFTGHYVVDGERVDVDAWRGMEGHNWGRRHAELYAWAHCNQWENEEDLIFEGATARVKVGPLLAPPLTVLAVWSRGVRYPFNAPLVLLRSRGEIGLRAWSFRAESRLARVEGELAAETRDFVGLRYENPDGAMTYCLNSKIAAGKLRFEVKGRPPLTARTRAAALEIGTRDPAHGIPILL
ncbi:MAG: hypothetical protein ABJE95_02185 [Byssovorax sp.]